MFQRITIVFLGILFSFTLFAQETISTQLRAPKKASRLFVKNSAYNINTNDTDFSPRIISRRSAAEIDTFVNTPVSVCEYFLARSIQGDSAAKTVLYFQEDDRAPFDELGRYRVYTAVITEAHASGPDKYIVTFYWAYTRTSQDGRTLSNRDDVVHFTCTRIKGKWMITGVPG